MFVFSQPPPVSEESALGAKPQESAMEELMGILVTHSILSDRLAYLSYLPGCLCISVCLSVCLSVKFILNDSSSMCMSGNFPTNRQETLAGTKYGNIYRSLRTVVKSVCLRS